MKTIEGTDHNIQDSIMLLTFICRFAYELTFQYCYPHNSIPKEGHPTCPYTAQSQLYWDTKKGKGNAKHWNQINVTSLVMPR